MLRGPVCSGNVQLAQLGFPTPQEALQPAWGTEILQVLMFMDFGFLNA